MVGLTKNMPRIDPAGPPDLSYTIIQSIVLDGKRLPARENYWNRLMMAVIRKAAETLPTNQVVARIICNYQIGKRSDVGFKYIPGVGISIQALNSNKAWEATLHLLRQLRLPVALEFEWANIPAASGNERENAGRIGLVSNAGD